MEQVLMYLLVIAITIMVTKFYLSGANTFTEELLDWTIENVEYEMLHYKRYLLHIETGLLDIESEKYQKKRRELKFTIRCMYFAHNYYLASSYRHARMIGVSRTQKISDVVQEVNELQKQTDALASKPAYP